MSAFNPGHGNGLHTNVDLEDMLQQMFGMDMGGGIPAGFSGGSRRPEKGSNDEVKYNVTLEEMYKGKTAKFSVKKNVICSHCKGSGGREKATPRKCSSCDGKGMHSGAE